VNRIPYTFWINAPLHMDHEVPHGTHVFPRHIGVALFNVIGNPTSCLTNCDKVALNCIKRFAVVGELFKRISDTYDSIR